MVFASHLALLDAQGDLQITPVLSGNTSEILLIFHSSTPNLLYSNVANVSDGQGVVLLLLLLLPLEPGNQLREHLYQPL